MKEFMTYFWGAGEEVEFTYFSLAHLLPIAIMLAVIGLIIILRKKLRNFKHEDKIRLTLGFMLIITEMTYFWRLVGIESLNANPIDHLPITVCGWAVIFSTFLVLTKNQTLYDIAYFWVLTGSIFGILTPTVITYCGPTRIRYYQFWLEHTLGFITIFYMTFVHNMRPKVKSIFKSYAFLAILGAIAIWVNLSIPGANYLFMAEPEDVPSVLDILPKNYPLRIALMAVAMALLFFIAYLPWLIIDKRKKKSNPELATDSKAQKEQKTSKKRNKDDIVIQDFKASKTKFKQDSGKDKSTKPIAPDANNTNNTSNQNQFGDILSKIQTTNKSNAKTAKPKKEITPQNKENTNTTDTTQNNKNTKLTNLMAKLSAEQKQPQENTDENIDEDTIINPFDDLNLESDITTDIPTNNDIF